MRKLILILVLYPSVLFGGAGIASNSPVWGYLTLYWGGSSNFGVKYQEYWGTGKFVFVTLDALQKADDTPELGGLLLGATFGPHKGGPATSAQVVWFGTGNELLSALTIAHEEVHLLGKAAEAEAEAAEAALFRSSFGAEVEIFLSETKGSMKKDPKKKLSSCRPEGEVYLGSTPEAKKAFLSYLWKKGVIKKDVESLAPDFGRLYFHKLLEIICNCR